MYVECAAPDVSNPCSLHAPSSSVCAPAIPLRRPRHARYRRVSDGAVSTWFYFHHVLAVRRSTFSIETQLSLRGDLFFTAVLVTCVRHGRRFERRREEAAQPPRVLIADLDPDVLRQTNRCFASAGFDVAAAGDAARAITLLEGRRFDLLVLDAAISAAMASRPPPRFVAGCAHRSSSRVRAEQKPTSYAH